MGGSSSHLPPAVNGVSSSSSAAFSSWHPHLDVHVMYFNFRVYSSSVWGHISLSCSSSHNDNNDEFADDVSFYKGKECMLCRMASVIVCLSENDRSALRTLMREDVDDEDDCDDDKNCRGRDVHVLYPPLRGDIRELAMTYDERDGERKDEDNEHDDDDDAGQQQYNTGHGRESLDRFLPQEERRAIDNLLWSINVFVIIVDDGRNDDMPPLKSSQEGIRDLRCPPVAGEVPAQLRRPTANIGMGRFPKEASPRAVDVRLEEPRGLRQQRRWEIATDDDYGRRQRRRRRR